MDRGKARVEISSNEWSSEYFFAEDKTETLCLICHRNISVIKKFNIACRH